MLAVLVHKPAAMPRGSKRDREGETKRTDPSSAEDDVITKVCDICKMSYIDRLRMHVRITQFENEGPFTFDALFDLVQEVCAAVVRPYKDYTSCPCTPLVLYVAFDRVFEHLSVDDARAVFKILSDKDDMVHYKFRTVLQNGNTGHFGGSVRAEYDMDLDRLDLIAEYQKSDFVAAPSRAGDEHVASASELAEIRRCVDDVKNSDAYAHPSVKKLVGLMEDYAPCL